MGRADYAVTAFSLLDMATSSSDISIRSSAAYFVRVGVYIVELESISILGKNLFRGEGGATLGPATIISSVRR